MNPTRLILCSLTSLSLTAQAQQQSSPNSVPSLYEQALGQITHLGAQADEVVLVPALKQLQLVGRPDLAGAEHQQDSIVRHGVPDVLHNPEVDMLLQDYLHNPVSEASLKRLQRSIRLYLSGEGFPYSLVYLPEQDITEGRIRIVVKESVIGAIKVEGNRYFSDQDYLQHLPLRVGDPLDGSLLDPALQAINNNQYRNAKVKLMRGSEPGTTDVVLITRDKKTWQAFIGYNDSGSLSTDEHRLLSGFAWGNLFGLDHSINMQWTSDPKAAYSRSLSGNYQMPLGPNWELTILGAYSETEANLPPPMEMRGKSWQLGARLNRQLAPLFSQYQHSLELAWDFKSSDNNLDFILPPFVIPVTDNLTEIVQFGIRYQASYPDEYGYTRGAAALFMSPGGLTHNNQDDDFSATRAGAESDYLYAKLNIFRDTPLKSVLTGMNWQIKASYQWASGNLLGSEQLSAGGMHTVRGYEQGEVIGDQGLLLSQELLLPGISTSTWLGAHSNRDRLRLYLFQDYAKIWNVDRLIGEKSFELHSFGLGARYQFGSWVNASLAYGWQLKDSHSSDTGDSQKLHLSLRISY